MKEIKVLVDPVGGVGPVWKRFEPVGDDIEFIKRVVSCLDENGTWIDEEKDYGHVLSNEDMIRFSEMLPTFRPCYILSIQCFEETVLF